MRPTLTGRALPLFLLIIAACQTTHRIDFVPVDTRVLSTHEWDDPEEKGGGWSRVQVSWRVYGWYRDEGDRERGPEIIVILTCVNRSKEAFILEKDGLRILDDEGRPFYPDMTQADREAPLVTPPGSTYSFQIPFRPEGEVSLDRVASIRVAWAFQIGEVRRELETKFFRRSIAAPRREGWNVGTYWPFFLFPG